MGHRWRGIGFLCFMSVYGPGLSAAQLEIQQVNGIVGESFTFPVAIPNLTAEIEVHWRYGAADPHGFIARLQDGKIKTDFNERFNSRLQLNRSTGSLQINNLSTKDSGFYQVETVKDIYSKRLHLSVYTPVPEPAVKLVHAGRAQGNGSCTLLCFAGNASEGTTVSWMRDGKSLHTTELELSQDMQGGNFSYTCVASNRASNRTTTVTPSEYCDERKDNTGGPENPMSRILIPVLVIAGIGVLAVILMTLYLRKKKTEFEKEGYTASRNSGDIEYSEIMNTVSPTGRGQHLSELAPCQTRGKLTTIYDELRQPPSSGEALC